MEFSKELGKLKFKLFHEGIKTSDEELSKLKAEGYRVPSIIRTGASFGLEAVIDNLLPVNIPISNSSSIILSNDFKDLIENNEPICSIAILKDPISVSSESGVINEIAKICFDRLGITLYSGCDFKERDIGCKFCGINYSNNFTSKKLLDSQTAFKLVSEALSIPNNGIRHILLSGGVIPLNDYGGNLFAETASLIKSHYPYLSIYVMLPPPPNNYTLQKLIDAGIDEIALNIEIIDENIRKKFISGKNAIGIKRYLEALEYLSINLPKFGSRSILMGGIEPINSTLKGIELLCKIGVMPIISHFRPVKKTNLTSFLKTENDIYSLWEGSSEIAEKYNMVIGPTCIPCQSNSIALPNNDLFIYY
jgi:lipoate synthase